MSITARSLILCLLACTAASVSASEVRVWGDTAVIDTYDTTRAILTVPTGLAGKDVISIKSAQVFALALTSDKQVFGWGKDPTVNGVPIGLFTIPTAVQGHAVQIEVLSGNGACALLDSGAVVAWGFDSNLQVTQAPTSTDFSGVGRGQFGGVAWTSAGVPTVWGQDAPIVPASTNVVEAIVLTDGVVYRRVSDNQVMSFGPMTAYPNLAPPVPAISATKLVVGVGIDALFAIRADGTVTAWGSNTTGLLTPPPGLTGVTQVAGGLAHANAIRGDGYLIGWGSGITATNGLRVPAGSKPATGVAAGRGFTVGVFSGPAEYTAPTALAWANAPSIVSGSAVGTEIGTVVVSNMDPNESHVLSPVSGIGSDDNALVSVANSQVRVAGAINGPRTLSIRLRATGQGGLSTEASLTVTVTAAPDDEGSDSKGAFSCGLGGGVALLLGLSLGLQRLRREQGR
jgi:hypothetical protein